MGDDEERDARAAALAQALWPGRYLGDLTRSEWERVYRELDQKEVTDGPAQIP
jgi:hypothetical protein